MYQKIIKKYKATTLVEIMIALAITSFAMTLSVLIYLNIQKSTLPFLKIKAAGLGKKYMNETVVRKDYFDSDFEEEGFLIKKTVSRNQVYSDCYDITINVADANKKKLLELQTTVYAE